MFGARKNQTDLQGAAIPNAERAMTAGIPVMKLGSNACWCFLESFEFLGL